MTLPAPRCIVPEMRPFAIPCVLFAAFLAACGGAETSSSSAGSGAGGSGSGGAGTGGSAAGGSGTGGTLQNDCPAGSSKLVADIRDLGPYFEATNDLLTPLLSHGIHVSGCIGPWGMDYEEDPQQFQGIDGGGDAGVVTFGGPDVDLVPPDLASAFSPAALTSFFLFDHDEKFSFVDIRVQGGVQGAIWEVQLKCAAEQQSPLDESNIVPVSMKCPEDSEQKPRGLILFNGGADGISGVASFDFVL